MEHKGTSVDQFEIGNRRSQSTLPRSYQGEFFFLRSSKTVRAYGGSYRTGHLPNPSIGRYRRRQTFILLLFRRQSSQLALLHRSSPPSTSRLHCRSSERAQRCEFSDSSSILTSLDSRSVESCGTGRRKVDARFVLRDRLRRFGLADVPLRQSTQVCTVKSGSEYAGRVPHSGSTRLGGFQA